VDAYIVTWGFAFAWGAFPALQGFGLRRRNFEPEDCWSPGAPGLMLKLAQRRLSTPVRELRRRTVSVSGEQQMTNGRTLAARRGDDRRAYGGRADGLCGRHGVVLP